MLNFNQIEFGSVLGINYSGMHDSSIAIVGPDGDIFYACALERLTRVKQDGRPPFAIIQNLPWDRFRAAAISTDFSFVPPLGDGKSKLLQVPLSYPRSSGLHHGPQFYQFLETIPIKKEYVCHQLAHAASAFWASEYESSLCLTYDGGMANSPWFGGLYACDRQTGIKPLDQFSALHYAKITTLYTFVTALLGFTPNKHEGKITGLAAYGKPTDSCRNLLNNWFRNEYFDIESAMSWIYSYDSDIPPMLLVNEAVISAYRAKAQLYSKEEIAATVQEILESHVLHLIDRAKCNGWVNDNICLAGGLFSNVKLNQKIADSGFKNLFVAPSMTDDGTALGAAWQLLFNSGDLSYPKVETIYVGPSFQQDHIKEVLISESIDFSEPDNLEQLLAQYLADGKVVAIFRGAMEFGPRALGNRSIISQATKSNINQSLNERLCRTEFMPFAPISRAEDAGRCYKNIDNILRSTEFMTVTVNCTDELRALCPAVVHIDGTARPQILRRENNRFVYDILTCYQDITGNPALVNTSFNIHEEPIVCTPEDAIEGFFESGLDYLCLEDQYLISYKENMPVAVRYLQKKLRTPSYKTESLNAVNKMYSQELAMIKCELLEKELEIRRLSETLTSVEAEGSSYKDKQLIAAQANELKLFYIAYGKFSPLRYVAKFMRILRPRLGNLNQYVPRRIEHENYYHELPQKCPKISIVTPSFSQGQFIEKTILSILNQQYPNLEYCIQDGGSLDGTVEILKKYEFRISEWESKKDNGQSHALNQGFAKTSGEIMAWINSDDFLLPGTLALVAKYFNEHPEVDVLYGDRLLVDESDMEIGRWIMPDHDSDVLSWVDFVPQESLFWRRRIWEKVGGKIDESFSFAMDWDLILRFRDAGAKFAHIPKFLGAFRIHSQQKTSSEIFHAGQVEMSRIRKRLHGYVPLQSEIRKAIALFLFRHLLADIKYRLKIRIRGLQCKKNI